MLSAVPHSRLLRHIPPPSRFLESYLQEGTLFFAPCQVVPLYYFTSFRRAIISLGHLWAIWLFLSERCASRLRVEVAFTNQAAVDGPRRRRVRRGLHYSWAVILADLCTGEPVDGRSVVVRIAAPHTSPSRFLESYLLEGTFSLRARWSSYISSHRSDG